MQSPVKAILYTYAGSVPTVLGHISGCSACYAMKDRSVLLSSLYKTMDWRDYGPGPPGVGQKNQLWFKDWHGSSAKTQYLLCCCTFPTSPSLAMLSAPLAASLLLQQHASTLFPLICHLRGLPESWKWAQAFNQWSYGPVNNGPIIKQQVQLGKDIRERFDMPSIGNSMRKVIGNNYSVFLLAPQMREVNKLLAGTMFKNELCDVFLHTTYGVFGNSV